MSIMSLPLLLCIVALGVALFVGALTVPARDRDRPVRDRDHVPQHAALPRRPVPSHARTARPFADPQDAPDPDGSVWTRSLKASPGWEPTPVPVLARVRAGLLALDELPAAGEPDVPPADSPEPEWVATGWTQAMAEAAAADWDLWLDENVRSVKVPGSYDRDEGAAA